MNLLASFADDFDEEEEEGGDAGGEGEDVAKEEDSSDNWTVEYKRGCDFEIYTSELSDIFVGWQFVTLSEYLYQKLGIVLFGLQIEDAKQTKVITRTLLNPAGEWRVLTRKQVKYLWIELKQCCCCCCCGCICHG